MCRVSGFGHHTERQLGLGLATGALTFREVEEEFPGIVDALLGAWT